MVTTTACPTCGASVRAGTQFCVQCGADVRATQESADTVDIGLPPPMPRPDDLMELLRKATAGEFEILSELGRGGMATVFLADDLSLERKVAIKVMSPSVFSGGDTAERFKREARTVGGLSHPHVIPIYAVRETKNLLFFVMKYVEGRGLDDILKEFGPLPIRMVQAIVSQVSSALQHAHRKQIIHRDVKPANIMLDDDGWAVVTDFGIAKVARQVELTKTGSTVGTPYYMSPEQCSGTGVVPASDQYSLGIVAYEMLTGRVPFRGMGIMDIMRGHFVEPPPPILELRRDCPPWLAHVVMRMLAKEPDERYPTLEDVVTAMDVAQLSSDDPTRTQMVELARSGARSRPSIPAGKAPPRARNTVANLQNARTPASGRPILQRNTPAPDKRSWRPVLLVFGALAFVALGWGLAFLLLRPDTRSATAQAPVTTLQVPPQGQQLSALAPASKPAVESVAIAPTPIDSPKVSAPPASRRPNVEPSVSRPQATRAREPEPEIDAAELIRRSREQQRESVRPRPAEPVRPKPAPVPNAAAQVGYIRISTKSPNARLYINSVPQPLPEGISTLPVKPGRVELRVIADGCEPSDWTGTVAPGDTQLVGRLNAKCQSN